MCAQIQTEKHLPAQQGAQGILGEAETKELLEPAGQKKHYNLQRGLGSRQKAATALQKLVSSAHSWIHAEVTGYCPKEPLCVRELPLHSPSDRQEHQAGSRLHDPGHIHRETLSIID